MPMWHQCFDSQQLVFSVLQQFFCILDLIIKFNILLMGLQLCHHMLFKNVLLQPHSTSQTSWQPGFLTSSQLFHFFGGMGTWQIYWVANFFWQVGNLLQKWNVENNHVWNKWPTSWLISDINLMLFPAWQVNNVEKIKFSNQNIINSLQNEPVLWDSSLNSTESRRK